VNCLGQKERLEELEKLRKVKEGWEKEKDFIFFKLVALKKTVGNSILF
jgi:hypothetical protein